MQESLYSYLQNNTNPYYFELLQYDIKKRLYHYGENFKSPFKLESSLTDNWLDLLRLFFPLLKQKKINPFSKALISNAYFSFNQNLRKEGFQPFTVPWALSKKAPYIKDNSFYIKSLILNIKLKYLPANKLLNDHFYSLIDDYQFRATRLIKNSNISACVFSNDLGFNERLFIDIFKSLERPSFIFSHGGLPVVNNCIDDNRADYLLVWGEKIKESFINLGIDPLKIFVTGHPNYTNINVKSLKFNFENILVLTKTSPGVPHNYSNLIVSDRGNAILYLLQIQNVLSEIGVKKVRLRLHPSENPNWYLQFLDKEFFKIEDGNLSTALRKSTLVIGPASTVILEALYSGVNYVIYEPCISKIDIFGYELIAPFDGSNSKTPAFNNISDLKHALVTKESCDLTVIPEYFKAPFDISCLKNIIK